MFDEKRAARELARLADQWTLEASDYERLAMAVFGEMLAKEAAKADLWRKRAGGLISFHAYTDGRKGIEESKALQPCWRRLRQDLYEGNRQAVIGIQCAFAYAKAAGLSLNPRWGGERKREVERILLRQGIDPNAPPGLRTIPREVGEPREPTEPEPEYVRPDVRGDSLAALPINEPLGIGDFWIDLPVEDRYVVNAMLADLDEPERISFLKKLAGDRLYDRVNNRDIPRASSDWVRDFPRQLGEVVLKLPPRSRAILGARYQALRSRQDREMLHQSVLGQMIDSDGRVGGEDLLKTVMRHVCNSRDSVGAGLRYEMQLDQGTMSFGAYLQLRERHLPKLAKREQQMAARHAGERHQQWIAELQSIHGDPGLKHISERYTRMLEIAKRTQGQEIVALGRGFGKAAVGTVEGIVALLTTDPRKTAAGIYHLAKNPQILVHALDDAMVDQEEFMGGVLFELTVTALGAGPAAKASQAQKAVRLAQASEKAAEAGKLNAARRLADAAQGAADKARGTSSGLASGEADMAVRRARSAIDAQDSKLGDAAAGGSTKAADAAATPKAANASGDAARGAARVSTAIAVWVRKDARVALQRAVDHGPNKWGAMPNQPKGARFQRGLSGDYASGAGGFEEARRLLAGETDPVPRTVSRIGDKAPPGDTTHRTTSVYSDPMSVRGRADRIDPTRGRDPDREAMLDGLNLDDVEAIGFFPNVTSSWRWSQNYLRLLEQAAAVPAAGSRGEKFVAELKEVMQLATYKQDHIGRHVTNVNEVEAKLVELFKSYGTRTY